MAMLYSHSVDGVTMIRRDAGRVSDLGFADVAGGEIVRRPPETDNPRVDGWVSTKFFSVKQEGGPGSLGTAELREAVAHDDMMRGDLDLTGVKLAIYLRQQPFASYETFIGVTTKPITFMDPEAWHGHVVLRLPTPAFAFPAPRGGPDPWSSHQVGKLRRIKGFSLRRLEITKLKGVEGLEPYAPPLILTRSA